MKNYKVWARPPGSDWNLDCFVCGNKDMLMSNICFIPIPEEVDSLKKLLKGSRIAYYHGDPEVPQIKVGSCKEHYPNLHALYIAAASAKFINQWMIARCIALGES